MQSVGIRELKNHLSRYLREVRGGREVLVTERGRAVAKIVPIFAEEGSEAEALLGLSRAGLVRMPESGEVPELSAPIRIKGSSIADTVIEGRR